MGYRMITLLNADAPVPEDGILFYAAVSGIMCTIAVFLLMALIRLLVGQAKSYMERTDRSIDQRKEKEDELSQAITLLAKMAAVHENDIKHIQEDVREIKGKIMI